jgi:hypothetical protein
MHHLYYDKEGVDFVKNTIPRNDDFWEKYHPVPTDVYAENLLRLFAGGEKQQYIGNLVSNANDVYNAIEVLAYQNRFVSFLV